MFEADTTFTSVTTPYDIADGGWVIRGSANAGATKNQFDGDLETPAGVNIALLPGGGKVGIGTASMTSLLNVAAAGSAVPTIRISSALSGAHTFSLSAAIPAVSNTGFDIRDETSNAHVLTINSSDNVGIGDTNPAQAFSIFGKFLVNSSGVATNYNGVALGGTGQPYLPSGGVVDLSAQTGSVTATNLFTPSANGLFRLSYYLTTTTAGSAGTVSVTFTWTDEAKAETFTSSTLSLSALGALAPQAPLVIYAKTTAAIQYSTTVSGATGSPQYSLHIRVEAL